VGATIPALEQGDNHSAYRYSRAEKVAEIAAGDVACLKEQLSGRVLKTGAGGSDRDGHDISALHLELEIPRKGCRHFVL
jgi:hypothetical protein